MRPRVTVVVWLLVVATASPSQAQTCRGNAPAVNKPGFRPGTTIPFALLDSPSGTPFPADAGPCVERAFEAWTAANAATALGVRFVPGPGGVVVRFDDRRGHLPSFVAGGWMDAERSQDGALVGATIWLSPNRHLISSCRGITKVVLHELGHLHGLADHRGLPGTTVMNDFQFKNDRGGRVALEPSRCDAEQAAEASAVLSSTTLAATALVARATHGWADDAWRRR